AGGDHQPLRMQRAREQAGRMVLVDDRLDAAILATLVLDHRNSSAAAGHDDITRIDQMRDDLEVEDRLRRRRGHDAPPAASRIDTHLPAEALGALAGSVLVHWRANGLGGIAVWWVGAIDEHLRDDSGFMPCE